MPELIRPDILEKRKKQSEANAKAYKEAVIRSLEKEIGAPIDAITKVELDNECFECQHKLKIYTSDTSTPKLTSQLFRAHHIVEYFHQFLSASHFMHLRENLNDKTLDHQLLCKHLPEYLSSPDILSVSLLNTIDTNGIRVHFVGHNNFLDINGLGFSSKEIVEYLGEYLDEEAIKNELIQPYLTAQTIDNNIKRRDTLFHRALSDLIQLPVAASLPASDNFMSDAYINKAHQHAINIHGLVRKIKNDPHRQVSLEVLTLVLLLSKKQFITPHESDLEYFCWINHSVT